MSKTNEASFDDFEFDEDFSGNSIHLEEFRKRMQHQTSHSAPKPSADEESASSGSKFIKHHNPSDTETAFPPQTDDFDDDFSDGSVDFDDPGNIEKSELPKDSDFFGESDLSDDAGFSDDFDDSFNPNDSGLSKDSGLSIESDVITAKSNNKVIPVNTFSSKEQSSAKFWVLIAVSLVGIAAAIIALQSISKNSSHSVSENHYPDPVISAQSNEDISSSEGTAEANSSSSDATETTETQPSSTVYVTLQLGDKSEDVKKMQIRLKKLGYLNEKGCTGYYGNVTEKMIKFFQKKAGLDATGIADPKTLEVLFSDDAPSCY